MHRLVVPALMIGVCSLAIASPWPQHGSGFPFGQPDGARNAASSRPASPPSALGPPSCVEYSTLAAFESCIPDATCEDFEDMSPGAGVACAATTPWDSSTDNLCIDPGEIEGGLEFVSLSGDGVVFGSGFDGGQPLDSTSVGAADFAFIVEFNFDPPVDGVALDIENLLLGVGSVTIEVHGVSSGLILSTGADIDDSLATFWGVSCDEPIATVRVFAMGGTIPVVGSVKYGDRPPACETITDEAAFMARFPSLTLEDFEGHSNPPDDEAVCDTLLGCIDSTTGDGPGCLVAGEIEAGLTICTTDLSHVYIVGDQVLCNDASTSVSVGTARVGSGLRLSFDPPVRQVGVSLEGCVLPASTWDIDIFAPGDTLIDSTTADVTFAQSFWGVSCTTPIGSITFADRDGLEVELIDNIRFGDGCQVYIDGAAFAAAYPDLANYEDFEDISPGIGLACSATTPWDSDNTNACVFLGGIEPGITVDTPPISASVLGMGYVAGGGQPLDTTGVLGDDGGSGFDTAFRFDPDSVTVVALEIENALIGAASITIEIDGASGLIFSGPLMLAASTETFWAVVCDEPIEKIRVNDPGGTLPVVSSVRWGDQSAAFTRICSPAVPSLHIRPDTSSTMILETQNSDGELIGFSPSISANEAPNRLMMIVRDAPGTGNFGLTNVGYFIMGTGATTFVPTGSAGPICVFPGLKRFLVPPNMTSETITFHDPVTGAPTTVVGEGYSAAALGAGADPLGPTSIGGVAGCHWGFQAWYRDRPEVSGVSANLSDALVVDFVP